ncbi:hypothetical protein KI688_004124 [Linnemannia hyalina]|uniref:RNI-like protein n=1 Tax=Linnemannia hyalina TaxID=64524 RepID=A0A9P7XMM8_9FUNG|nr:hypothetical protein KI688_004124 [Linnemannia hyalina]
MELQSFRLIGSKNIEKVRCDQVDGHYIVYWEDIENGFPGVKHVKHDDVIINLMRDSNRQRIIPHCIKHYPGVVLDVVLASGGNHIHDGSAMTTSRLAPTDSRAETPTHTRGNTTHIPDQFVSLAAAIKEARRSGKPLTSEALSSLIASRSTPVSMAKPGFERTVIHKLDGLYDQGAMTQQIAREVWEMTKQMNDRLILIQSKTEAILTQQLELTEYPIPRLFIVLPEEPAKYDPGNWFRTKFRLHFICECGKHTETKDSKVPHHLHLAKHQGYLIREPTEFFKKYGPFLLLMLELIKFGTRIAGHVVPTLASLKVVELADSVRQSVESVTAKIDYSLECIDNQLAKVQASSPGDSTDTEPQAAMTQQDLANYLSDVEGLEGVELRQLGSLLKTSEEESLLGNLYRMTTSDGHVKWVCYEHYRVSYQEKNTQKLRDVVNLARGEFDEQLGRVEIVLTSRFAAAEFYNAVSKAKGVVEVIMDWDYECARSDLEELEDALKKSRVSILRLDLRRFRTSLGSKLLTTSAQFGALFRLQELSNMGIIHILISSELVKLLSFQPKKPSHLCKLSFEVATGTFGKKEFGILVESLKTNSTLTILSLRSNSIGDNGAQALSEALKTNSTLTALDLWGNSIEGYGAQALSEALKTNSTLTTLTLQHNSIGSNGAQALSEALKINSTLTTLDLRINSIGDSGAQELSEALKTNSTLTTLDLGTNLIGSDGAQALSEALRTNSTLTTLNLGHNPIGDNGAQALSEALKTNSTLTTLDLRVNSIGGNGAQALSEALKTNSTLTTLNLGSNSTGSNGAQALSEALRTNSTLTTLNFRRNSIGDNGAQALSEALKTNSTLATLDLELNSIGSNGAQALSEALKINSTVTISDPAHPHPVPEADLWPLLATSWDKVESSCICVGFRDSYIMDQGTSRLLD